MESSSSGTTARRIRASRRRAAVKMALAGALLILATSIARADAFTPGTPAKVASVTTGSNYTHTEGPIYDHNGGILFGELNSSHASDLLWRYDITAKTVATVLSNSGGTQGDAYTTSGQLVTADRDTRQVALRNPTTLAVQSVLAATYNGKQFNGPNDVVTTAAGGVYFTDPNFENFSNTPGVDAVYYIPPGAAVTQVLTYGTTGRPNGIALSPDQKTLYVGLWANNNIFQYDISAAGTPTNGRLFATVTSPDGITIDPWGNLIAARSNGITCWNPAGAVLFNLTTNTQVTNVELGGADGKTLYFTAYGTALGLYSAPLTQVPEPASLVIFLPALLWACYRRK